MRDAGRGCSYHLYWLLAAHSRQRKVARLINSAFQRIGGQRLVRPALWYAEREHRRNQHAGGAGHARRKLCVGIKRDLRFGNHLAKPLANMTQAVLRHGWIGKDILHFAYKDHSPVGLGLEEKSRMRNGLGLGSRELVDQPRMNVARPRPAADVGDTLVVNRNDGNAIGRLA